MVEGYIDFLIDTKRQWRCNRVVCLGDLADWYCLSYHEKNPVVNSANQEVRDAKRKIQELAKAFPKADWMIGNHDALPFRKAKTAGLPEFLLKDYSDFWEINWKPHPRHAELIIDNVIYQHGDKQPGGKQAALKHAMAKFRSVVQGHHHTNAGVNTYSNGYETVFGLDAGCGLDVKKIQFEYGKIYSQQSVLGCGVVLEGKHAFFERFMG